MWGNPKLVNQGAAFYGAVYHQIELFFSFLRSAALLFVSLDVICPVFQPVNQALVLVTLFL